jgi:hypothetical protein
MRKFILIAAGAGVARDGLQHADGDWVPIILNSGDDAAKEKPPAWGRNSQGGDETPTPDRPSIGIGIENDHRNFGERINNSAPAEGPVDRWCRCPRLPQIRAHGDRGWPRDVLGCRRAFDGQFAHGSAPSRHRVDDEIVRHWHAELSQLFGRALRIAQRRFRLLLFRLLRIVVFGFGHRETS